MTDTISGTLEQRRDAASFPFGVRPEAAAPDRDGRGPDTMNRLLLHAARYHARDAVSLRWEEGRTEWGWQPMPDWRADRYTVRAALVLRQRLEVADGETVALWLPLSTEWPIVERAVWSIGAVSVPVWPEWDLERVAQVMADAQPAVLVAPDWEAVRQLRVIGGLPESVRGIVLWRGAPDDAQDALPFAQFLDYGGVLDTAERAAMWRTLTRGLSPDTAVSREYTSSGPLQWGKLDHRMLVAAVERMLRRFPAHAGRVQVLTTERPHPTLRALIFAGWVDGLTRTIFAATSEAQEHLEAFVPDLVVGPAESLGSVLRTVQAAAAAPEPPAPRRGLLARLLGVRSGDDTAPRRRPRAPTVRVLLTDGAPPALDDATVTMQFVEESEIDVFPIGPGMAGQGQ